MSGQVEVRRVRVQEWREIRDLRIEAVSDPDAAIAFLTTVAEERARDEAFWRERAAASALGEDSAQFIADAGGRWIGTATAQLRKAGEPDAEVAIVGVYVAPDQRGGRILASLIDAIAAWAAGHGASALVLGSHTENVRAQAAYRRLGFTPTGQTMTSPFGLEIAMRREGGVSL